MVPGTGLLAACVPGTFESWMLLLRDYGTLRLRDVLEPAIAYARDGYPLVERVSATIKTVEQLFRKHWPTSAAVYLPNGEVPKPGAIFTNRKLAETYTRILQEAESAGRDRVEAPARRHRTHWRCIGDQSRSHGGSVAGTPTAFARHAREGGVGSVQRRLRHDRAAGARTGLSDRVGNHSPDGGGSRARGDPPDEGRGRVGSVRLAVPWRRPADSSPHASKPSPPRRSGIGCGSSAASSAHTRPAPASRRIPGPRSRW